MHQHYITKFLGIKIELILTKINQLTMNQRLKILIEHLGFTSVRSFAKHIGEDYPDKLSRLFRDSQAKLGYESLRNILTTFPEVNAEWLMIGQGPMIRGNSSHGDRIAEICTQNNLTVEMLAEQIGHSPTLLHEMINDPKSELPTHGIADGMGFLLR